MSRYLTYNFRIKDSNKALVAELRDKASNVNLVWNFCNETQKFALKHSKVWPNTYKLQELTSGMTKELGLASSTVQSICEEYATRRKQFKKSSLKWRSYKKSLLWVPFKASGVKVNREDGSATYYGTEFKFWKSREIEGQICTGSIVADPRGRFYLNLTCKLPDFEGPIRYNPVGIDLGLKEAATLSDGKVFVAQRYTRQYQNQLAKSQRAKKKNQTRKWHAKIANSRKDFNHKTSTEIVKNYSHIVVGDVSSSKLAKTNMAKSVYDVGWFQLKSLLRYKALAIGVSYLEVSEKYSTQICSDCDCIPSSSPKGIKDLSVREWVCSKCGSIHNRDVNAARNILRFGHESPTALGLFTSLVPPGIPGL